MRLLILILSLYFCHTHGISQYVYFNQVTGVSGDLISEGVTNIEIMNDQYFVWGGGINNSVQFKLLRTLDVDGSIVTENNLLFPDSYVYSGITNCFQRIPGEESFLMSHAIVDSEGTKGFLMKVDNSLDTLWTKKLDMYAPYTYVFTHTWDEDGFILAGEHGNGPGVRGTFIAKVDTEGELLWTQVIHPPTGAYRNVQISALDNGYVVSGASSAGGDTEGYIETLSQSGILLNSFEGTGGIFRGIMIHTLKSDGNLVVSQTIGTEQVPGTSNVSWSYFKIRLYTLDPNSDQFEGYVDVFENDDMAAGGLAKIIELEDHSLIILGNHHRYIDEILHKRAFISKLNPSYQVDWYTELAYDPCSSCDNTLYDIEIAPDGGYIMAGKFHDDATDPRDKSWLVKVDACGDLEWQGCAPVGLHESEFASGIEVWPNPAGTSATLSVRLPSGVQAERLSLVNSKGQVVYLKFEELRLNANHDMGSSLKLQTDELQTPPGLYFLIITSRDGRLFSEKVVIE